MIVNSHLTKFPPSLSKVMPKQVPRLPLKLQLLLRSTGLRLKAIRLVRSKNLFSKKRTLVPRMSLSSLKMVGSAVDAKTTISSVARNAIGASRSSVSKTLMVSLSICFASRSSQHQVSRRLIFLTKPATSCPRTRKTKLLNQCLCLFQRSNLKQARSCAKLNK